MRTITTQMIAELIEQAANSPRKRTIFRLHEHEEPVQRMINALVPGTYVTPHKHENPDKTELMAVLAGQIAMLQYSAEGEITEVHLLDADGPLRVVDIAPRTYHSMVALTRGAVLEIIQGPYNAATHKQFAPWAPQEDHPEAQAYLAHLEIHVRAALNRPT